jgi:hypothetical protein
MGLSDGIAWEIEHGYVASPPLNDSTNPKDRLGIAKPGITSVPPSALLHLGRAMDDGKRKYGLMNWREKKVVASIYLDAAWRHVNAWYEGEEESDDASVHHLAHAMACFAIIIDAQATGNLVDDRPVPGNFADLVKQFTKKD